MWGKWNHILITLNNLIGCWTEVEQAGFDEGKAMLAQKVILNFPDFSKPFGVPSDVSDLQLGAGISQDGKSLAYYTRKLNSAQKNYTAEEKELLDSGRTESI